MGIDARLRQATQNAIEASQRINPAHWPEWADNVAIFTLARHLAAVDSSSEAEVFEPYVLAFWSATKEPADWDEAWEQFLDVWDHDKARIPVGNLAHIAAARARDKPDMEWAAGYRPKLRLLVRVCIEIARMRRDKGRFKLSQTDAGEIIGCTQPQAGRMIHRLCRDGVLCVVNKPKQGALKAIKYRILKPYPD